MSNEAFEKWFVVSKYNDEYYQIAKEAWQVAKADSEQEIAMLIVRVGDVTQAYQEKVNELQAHINDLREAFRKIRSCYGDGYEVDNIARQALSKTPAQHINDDVVIFDKKSLQEHDNEVIEKCANVCENNDGSWADYIWNEAVNNCARQIRALKGIV